MNPAGGEASTPAAVAPPRGGLRARMTADPPPADRFARDGFLTVPNLLPAETTAALRDLFAEPVAPAGGRRGGVRGLFDSFPAVRDLAVRPEVWGLAADLLGFGPVAVRATLFDKTAAANWAVPVAPGRTARARRAGRLAGLGRLEAGRRGLDRPAAAGIFYCGRSPSGCIWTTAARRTARCGSGRGRTAGRAGGRSTWRSRPAGRS